MPMDADAAAAGAHAARARLNRRPKFTLHDSDAARLRLAAKARGLKQSAFVRKAVLAAIHKTEGNTSASPAAPASRPPNARTSPHTTQAKDPAATVRKKLFLRPDENSLLVKEAKAAALLQQDYMRLAVVAALLQASPPKRKPAVSKNELAHEIAMIAFQLKKVGTNLNQLAKQANTAMVPITREEILYFMNTHQRILTMASAALEKVLA